MRFRQVHIDFHTSEKIDGIGKEFNKEQFQTALKMGNVDSITIFSKCHHGWAYHPSNANKMHPGLDFDLLKAQIEAAHEIGVKTPVYISAGYDEKIAREHPEWRFEDREHNVDNFAKPMYHLLCMNTPYLDYLLEQIKEVVQNYDADGIFLDIVKVRPCCCSTCVGEMLKRGMNPNEEKDILALGEEVYANYLKRVRETVDSVKPGLPVFHNEGHIRHGRRELAYANAHLELESLPTGGWGYDHFPVSARYVWNLGMEYLGMTGKFHNSWGEFGGYKHPDALKYETALSVAHGAKCSIGDQLHPNGKMDMKTYEIIGKAYSDIKEKEEWLDNTVPICDIGVLSYETIQNLGISENQTVDLTEPDIGAGRILIEGKYQFSVIDAEVDFEQFKVIILPDKIVLNDFLKAKIEDFTAQGGKILATGESGISDGKFLFDFGAEYIGEGDYLPSYIRPCYDNEYDTDYIMYTPYKKIKLTNGKELAKTVEPYFNRTVEHFCSHRHAPLSGISNSVGVVEGKDMTVSLSGAAVKVSGQSKSDNVVIMVFPENAEKLCQNAVQLYELPVNNNSYEYTFTMNRALPSGRYTVWVKGDKDEYSKTFDFVSMSDFYDVLNYLNTETDAALVIETLKENTNMLGLPKELCENLSDDVINALNNSIKKVFESVPLTESDDYSKWIDGIRKAVLPDMLISYINDTPSVAVVAQVLSDYSSELSVDDVYYSKYFINDSKTDISNAFIKNPPADTESIQSAFRTALIVGRINSAGAWGIVDSVLTTFSAELSIDTTKYEKLSNTAKAGFCEKFLIKILPACQI